MKKSKNLFMVFVGLAIGLALSGCQNPFLQIGKDAVSFHIETPFTHTDEIIEGDGTAGSPLLVYDIVTLKRVGSGEIFEGNTWALDKHYLQIKDIDWAEAGEEWAPIGDSLNRFSGSYAGGGKTISNLKCITGSSGIGLFAYIHSGARVNNLKLRDVDFKGRSSIGGIAGENEGSIEDCSVTGSIGGNSAVGGIAGQNNGLVERCSAGGTYSCASMHGGGIVGINYSETIKDCYAVVTFIDSIDCSTMGGIAGENFGGTLINCYADVSLSGLYYIGGITGNFSTGTIKNCVALSEGIESVYADSACRIFAAFTVMIGPIGHNYSYNYANSNMLVNGFPLPLPDDYAFNGQGIGEELYNDKTWWTASSTWSSPAEAWDFATVWAWDEVRQLPVLRGAGGQ